MAFHPVLMLASLYATWLAAWVVLGHRPRPSLDDPKSIALLVDGFYILTCLLLAGALPAAGSCLGFIFADGIRQALRSGPPPRFGWLVALVVTAVALWFGGYVLLQADPAGVFYWFID